ncbi:MAG: (d)CMP kinase [Gammaproteobacteria bacterium]|nr:(d)CMP kinase [Gammaproteobacteria bacterium]NND60270.1 (d)CMP kinase [Gammaproteobacteria bacterium]
MTIPVITIDGPGGAGKGTISQAVATRLGWHYLDSGALYRIAGLAAARAPDIAPGELVSSLDLDIVIDDEGQVRYRLGGEDVSEQIRTEEAGEAASRLAALPEVRMALTGLQHRFRRAPGLVADGRDMGTVIFPDAGLKIYLTASAAERARRRYKQLKDKGMGGSLAALFADISRRDQRDAQRKVSPLRPADDAVCIDTTGVAIDTVIGQVLSLAAQTFASLKE